MRILMLAARALAVSLGALMLLPIVLITGALLQLFGAFTLLYELGIFCETVHDTLGEILVELEAELAKHDRK